MCSSEKGIVTPPIILVSHIYRGKGMLQGLPGDEEVENGSVSWEPLLRLLSAP